MKPVCLQIRQEILAVLTHAEKAEDQRSGDVSHMSAQTVFSVLDYLTRWKRHRVQMLSVSRTQKKSQSGSEWRESSMNKCSLETEEFEVWLL